jgi:long-chain acyl-CoA synthetase
MIQTSLAFERYGLKAEIEALAKTNAFIEEFVVIGDKRNYLTALVTLQREKIEEYAKTNGIRFENYEELVTREPVRHLVQLAVDEMNEKLAKYETIKKFTIVPHPFSIEGGELTPSQKVKRGFVSRKYKQALDALYAEA